MAVWASGCMAVWASGCMAVWGTGCMAVCPSGCTGLWLATYWVDWVLSVEIPGSVGTMWGVLTLVGGSLQ